MHGLWGGAVRAAGPHACLRSSNSSGNDEHRRSNTLPLLHASSLLWRPALLCSGPASPPTHLGITHTEHLYDAYLLPAAAHGGPVSRVWSPPRPRRHVRACVVPNLHVHAYLLRMITDSDYTMHTSTWTLVRSMQRAVLHVHTYLPMQDSSAGCNWHTAQMSRVCTAGSRMHPLCVAAAVHTMSTCRPCGDRGWLGALATFVLFAGWPRAASTLANDYQLPVSSG